MNFNINDPAGVKALLDQLRSSQAWKEVSAPPVEIGTPTTSTVPTSSEGAPIVTDGIPPASATPPTTVTNATSNTVASLLAQLQSTTSWGASPQPPPLAPSRPASTIAQRPPVLPTASEPITSQPPATSRRKDPKSYTFQQALPHLAQLADDASFVAAVTQMKKEQDDMERHLWDDRRAIQIKYEEKVKIAKTKASMIGTILSKHEADMINEAYKKELQKFDLERALPAWDGLISKQQTAFALLNVPAMFPTSEIGDRERQQRVMQVLEGIVGGGEH